MSSFLLTDPASTWKIKDRHVVKLSYRLTVFLMSATALPYQLNSWMTMQTTA